MERAAGSWCVRMECRLLLFAQGFIFVVAFVSQKVRGGRLGDEVTSQTQAILVQSIANIFCKFISYKLFASYAKKGKKDSLFPHLLSEDMHAAAARTAAASGLICPPLPGHQARGARGSRSRGTLSVTSGAYESPSIQFLGSAARLEVMKPKPLFSIGLFADAQYADKDDYERPSEKGRTKYFRAVPERLAVALRDFKSK